MRNKLFVGLIAIILSVAGGVTAFTPAYNAFISALFTWK